MISVAVIDDNRLVRDGIIALLKQVADFRVVSAESSCDPLTLRRANAQVLLLDLGLRHRNSLRLALRIKGECPECRVIVMDVLPTHEDVMEFINAGVAGFIMKDATLDEFANTIRTVAAGGHVLPPLMTGTLFSRIALDAAARGNRDASKAVRMTPRERDVINLIAAGASNSEIARRLRIADHTVRSHVRNVMEKLMLHTRLQIAAYANRESAA